MDDRSMIHPGIWFITIPWIKKFFFIILLNDILCASILWDVSLLLIKVLGHNHQSSQSSDLVDRRSLPDNIDRLKIYGNFTAYELKEVTNHSAPTYHDSCHVSDSRQLQIPSIRCINLGVKTNRVTEKELNLISSIETYDLSRHNVWHTI